MALAFLSALAVVSGVLGTLDADEGVVGLLLIGRRRGMIGSWQIPIRVILIVPVVGWLLLALRTV